MKLARRPVILRRQKAQGKHKERGGTAITSGTAPSTRVMLSTYYMISHYRASTNWTGYKMEPNGVGVEVGRRGERALNTAGGVTYLQRGLLRAVNVHIPSF